MPVIIIMFYCIGGQSSSDALHTCSREVGIAVGVVILVVGIIAAVTAISQYSHLLAGDEVYNIYVHIIVDYAI